MVSRMKSSGQFEFDEGWVNSWELRNKEDTHIYHRLHTTSTKDIIDYIDFLIDFQEEKQEHTKHVLKMLKHKLNSFMME